MSELLNILVIDDEEDMRQFLLDILVPLEHQVFATASAEQGLELLPIHTFHLAFLDQNLPGMEGLVLGEFLRKNNPYMHVTLVTGSDDPKLERFAGVHEIEVIRKPFTVQQILDVITTYREHERVRALEEAQRSAPEHVPSFAGKLEKISERFAPLNVPDRASDRIVQVVRDALGTMRTSKVIDEEDRLVALAGLIAIEVLGIKPPKTSSGRTLREEYDALMEKNGRRMEFVLDD